MLKMNELSELGLVAKNTLRDFGRRLLPQKILENSEGFQERFNFIFCSNQFEKDLTKPIQYKL